MRNFYAFLCGILFATGLGVSQMTRPPKILGFLNFAGEWDPTLLVVFAAAVGTYLVFYYGVINESIRRPLEEYLKGKEKLEPRVVIGAILFGIGWGIGGLCPGPAITDLVTLQSPIFLFVGAMLLGMVAVNKIT